MTKPAVNLDAYRMIAESLLRLRQVLRDELRAIHGEDWPEHAIPDELQGHLVGRRAREASINWSLSDGVDLLDYATFADLFDIISANPGLLERFSSFALEPDLLRLRFLELDTILNRIAFARPVAESELGFLVSFDERLRKVGTGPPRERTGAKRRAEPATVSRVQRPVTPASAPGGPDAVHHTDAAAQEGREAATHHPAEAPEAGAGEQLAAALAEGKDVAVLASLYREITWLADGLWSHSAPLTPRIWERVRESTWYRDRFGKLGLKPVSDFYGLIEDARERLLAGTPRNELQDFLKERNFALTLLALRELFRRHLTS